MQALANLFQQAFDILGLPHWAGVAAVVGLLVLASPWILTIRRTDRARRHLKEALRTYGEARERLEAAAFAEVAASPDGLLALAEEADRNGRFALRDRAMEALRRTGKLPFQLRALERKVEGPMPSSSAEALVNVLALQREGLTSLAADRLALFRARWPEDHELAEVQLTSEPSSGASAT